MLSWLKYITDILPMFVIFIISVIGINIIFIYAYLMDIYIDHDKTKPKNAMSLKQFLGFSAIMSLLLSSFLFIGKYFFIIGVCLFVFIIAIFTVQITWFAYIKNLTKEEVKKREGIIQKILLVLSIFFIGFGFGYNFAEESMSIEKASNYILEHSNEYIWSVKDNYSKTKEAREKCVLDIENCPVFIREKKYREKQFENNPEEMQRSIEYVKENILNNFANTIPIRLFTIDGAIGEKYSSKNREYLDTLDVILNK